MNDIAFQCPHCQQHLVAREQLSDLTIACPNCEGHVLVPANEATSRLGSFDVRGTATQVAQRVTTSVRDGTAEFKSLDYSALIPRRDIFNPAHLNNRTVQWVLVLGLTPLVMFQIYRVFQLSLPQVLWMIQIYFCALWGLYFFSEIKPRRSLWRQALSYATFTAGIGIPLLLFIIRLPGVEDIYSLTASGSTLSRATGYLLGVGLFEEMTKALPLIVLGLRRGHIRGTRDGLFLGLISGLGFAAAEGVSYTVAATNMAIVGGAVSTQYIQLLFRLFSGPLLHGAMAGVVGWFVGMAALRSQAKWPVIVVGIILMGTLHGLYDLFSGSILGIGIAGIIMVMFLTYVSYSPDEEPQIVIGD